MNENRNIAFCRFQNTGDFCDGSEQFVVERPAIQIIQRSPWNEPAIQKTNCSPKTAAIGCFSDELTFRIVPNKMFEPPRCEPLLSRSFRGIFFQLFLPIRVRLLVGREFLRLFHLHPKSLGCHSCLFPDQLQYSLRARYDLFHFHDSFSFRDWLCQWGV